MKKLSTLLFRKTALVVLLLSVSAAQLYAQSVTINVKNVTLKELLVELQNKSNCNFSYIESDMPKTANITLSIKDKQIESILKEILPKNNLTYIRSGNTFIIKKAPAKVDISISGVVTDAITQEPMVGVAVLVKGTNIGTTTNTKGEYMLKAPEESILVANYIGYIPQEVASEGRNTINISLKEDENKIDEVTVVGIRGSLSKAIDIKQLNVNVVDAIVAEDIAKFPQSNVSESLQRISGIQITRDDAGGVGNEISIRGLSPEYTKVTINGDNVANSSASESYNFNTLPAEMFSKIEVSKAPKASTEEGGLGGTVDLIMRKPFEIKGQTLVVSAEGQLNTQQQGGTSVTPKVTATYGKNWGNKFGIIAGVTYNHYANTSEAYDVVRYDKKSYTIEGVDYKDMRIPIPRVVSQGQIVRRVSVNLSAQWQIAKNLNLTLVGVYNRNSQVETRYSPIWMMPGTNPTEIRNDGQFVSYIKYSSVTTNIENQQHTNVTDTYQTSATLKWNLSRNWRIGAKWSYSLNNIDLERFRYYAANTNEVAYSVENNRKFFEIYSPTNLSNVKHFKMDEARRYKWDNKDFLYSGKLDVVKRFNNVFSLEFGASAQSRTKGQDYFYKKDRSMAGADFKPVAAHLTGFMDNVSGANINEFLVFDWDKAYDKYGQNIDLSNARQSDGYYNITEDLFGGYAMIDVRTKKFKANFGVRAVNTQITSIGLLIDGGRVKKNVNENSYTDFLPSVNLSYEPIRKFFIKGSFSRVMTRPRIQDLSGWWDVNGDALTISAKNPDLKPFRANQYDLSFEWYPKEEILISVGLFRKDIESFITTQTRTIIYTDGLEYLLRQPVNGNNATVQGVEVGYQQPFTFLPSPFDGLGIVANYTLSLSNFKETTEGVEESYELPNNSKHSYNIIGYYEKYGFGLRVAYNYRSSYLREKPTPTDGLKYRAGVGQVDISASYDISKVFSVTCSVLNAFNAKKYEYIWEERYMDNMSIFGTTIQFGVRAKF